MNVVVGVDLSESRRADITRLIRMKLHFLHARTAVPGSKQEVAIGIRARGAQRHGADLACLPIPFLHPPGVAHTHKASPQSAFTFVLLIKSLQGDNLCPDPTVPRVRRVGNPTINTATIHSD